MPTCVPSECHYCWQHPTFSLTLQNIKTDFSNKHVQRVYSHYTICFPTRCKKKVPATKRFTVHRTSNVLTLSLKRFANFSGGKITKVNTSLKPLAVWKSCVIFINMSNVSVCRLCSGCWISRISEHPPLHVSELRRSCYVWPLCCSSALWLQLSCWPLLLLCQGKATRCTFDHLIIWSPCYVDIA